MMCGVAPQMVDLCSAGDAPSAAPATSVPSAGPPRNPSLVSWIALYVGLVA